MTLFRQHNNDSSQVSGVGGFIGELIGGFAGSLAGPEGAVGGGVMGAATGFINKYNQCHP